MFHSPPMNSVLIDNVIMVSGLNDIEKYKTVIIPLNQNMTSNWSKSVSSEFVPSINQMASLQYDKNGSVLVALGMADHNMFVSLLNDASAIKNVYKFES